MDMDLVIPHDPQEFRESVEGIDPEWTTTDDRRLIYPCGNVVRPEDECPNGHESPLKRVFMLC